MLQAKIKISMPKKERENQFIEPVLEWQLIKGWGFAKEYSFPTGR